MAFIDDVIKRVRDYDAARPRSRQAAVGWSEVGGCRAALGFRLDGAWESDETDTWAAQRGTAIHEYLGPILAGPGVRIEVDTEYRGIPGHADIVEPDAIDDIKTTSLANSKLWADDHSLLRRKRIQVHGYAAGLVDAGELPADCTVRLLVIPVDGTFADWWAYEEPFDRSLADEGADRLEEVRERMAAGETLPKDKPYAWCETWCSFFSLCRDTGQPDGEIITDAELAAAVERYGAINAQIRPLEQAKKSLAPVVRGLRGITPGGWKVGLSEAGEAGVKLDEARVRSDYEAWGVDLPEVPKPGAAPKLLVRRIKTAANGSSKEAAA
jgi:hypothetical protein